MQSALLVSGFQSETLRRLICVKQEMGEALRVTSSPAIPLSYGFISSPSFCSDVPGGFSVNQLEEAREGGDLHITCSANKYLYTELSWQGVNITEESLTTGLNIYQPPVGEFSTSLILLLSNLTARDSGVYRCSARHVITGQETHLDTQVVVTSEYFILF